VRQFERGEKSQRTLFMTENELKKLVNEAVSLHRALTIYGERLKTLKSELIREAKQHKEDFIITGAAAPDGPRAEPMAASRALIFPGPRFSRTSPQKTKLSTRFWLSLANRSTICSSRAIT